MAPSNRGGFSTFGKLFSAEAAAGVVPALFVAAAAAAAPFVGNVAGCVAADGTTAAAGDGAGGDNCDVSRLARNTTSSNDSRLCGSTML